MGWGVNVGKFGLGYWVMIVLSIGLAAVCLDGAIRMLTDRAYAGSIVAGGSSLVGQIILSLVGFLFFGGVGVAALRVRSFLLRQQREAPDLPVPADDQAEDGMSYR